MTNQFIKKYEKVSQINPSNSHWFVGWKYVHVSCFILCLGYYDIQKEARNIAGKDYVSEITRWPGHTKVINIPVYYG